tara:strand:+ start:2257 stop:2523 length:267 start_codon:yes stop_codon:yes gene_type:complete
MAISKFISDDPLAEAVALAGGPIPTAKACSVSRQAVDKWLARGQLPRTDYTGESSHAKAIASLAGEQGAEFSASDLLEALKEKAKSAA